MEVLISSEAVSLRRRRHAREPRRAQAESVAQPAIGARSEGPASSRDALARRRHDRVSRPSRFRRTRRALSIRWSVRRARPDGAPSCRQSSSTTSACRRRRSRPSRPSSAGDSNQRTDRSRGADRGVADARGHRWRSSSCKRRTPRLQSLESGPNSVVKLSRQVAEPLSTTFFRRASWAFTCPIAASTTALD